ncbi:MAG TPA: hypothetical protein DEU67_03505 [Acidobacteria bacterium]|nr:hypothetical protein [Acidobacteriota bacterium]
MKTQDADGHVTVRAVRIAEPIVVDGLLDDPVYEQVAAIDGFVQQLPDEGAPPTEPTEIWILFDDDNIYLSARCWDSQPDRMVADEMTRDARAIWRNELLSVIFDTFHDGRNGMNFSTNPLGGLMDNLVTDESAVNLDWNTVWDAQTSFFEQGWMVEMMIPFKSLRFKAGGGEQTWGINVSRRVQWKNESSFLSPVPASLGYRGMLQVSAAATLVGIEPPTTIRNLEIKPYAISGAFTNKKVTPIRSNDLTGEVGIDVKYGLTRSLIADFTVNTDFAQVEADEQQVNLTRFSLFFPEKREFFLEGQGIFSFGDTGAVNWGGPPSDTPVVFFSRRIGLEGGNEVPIRAGGRVTGRSGPYSIGLLNIQTGDSAAADSLSTNFSVVRVKRDMLRRSNFGVIYTRRSRLENGLGINQVYGADLNLRFYENINFTNYYAQTDTPGLAESNASYRSKFDYTGDLYGITAEHLTVGKNFNPEIGFVRRDNFRRNFAQFRFSPRPRSIPWLRRMIYQGSFDYITDMTGILETRESKLRLEMELENSDKWYLQYTDSFEGLPEEFKLTSDVILPVGGYKFGHIRTEYDFGAQRRVSGRLFYTRGTFYGGTRSDVGYQGRAVFTPQFAIEPRVSVSDVDLPQGSFTTTLLGTRASFTVSPRMFLAALIQFNSSNKAIDTNIRFRWEYEPGSDLFIVYSDGRDTGLEGFPQLENRSFVVKFTRLFRF